MIWHKSCDLTPVEQRQVIVTVNTGRPFTAVGYRDGNFFVFLPQGGGIKWEWVTGWAYATEVLDLTAQDSWEFSGVHAATGQMVTGGFYRQPNGGTYIVSYDGRTTTLVPVVPGSVRIVPQYME